MTENKLVTVDNMDKNLMIRTRKIFKRRILLFIKLMIIEHKRLKCV